MTTIISAGIPVGIRLHNPLNIRRSKVNWQGKSEIQSHPAFETFIDPHHGIRAAARNLLTYYRRDKLCTVASIVTKWAPPEDDNDTAAYISAVCERIHTGADTPLDLEDPDKLGALLVAMMKQEIGSVPYDEATISLAVAAAYSGSSGPPIVPPVYAPQPAPVAPAAPTPVVPHAPKVTTTGEKVVPPLVDQPTAKTTRKVRAGTVGAMGGLPVAWFAKVAWDHYFPAEPMPTEIALAIAAAASSAGSYLLAYYTRNRATGPVIEE